MAKADWRTGKIVRFEHRIVVYKPSEYNLGLITRLESISLKILFLFGDKIDDDNTVKTSPAELAEELNRSVWQARRGLRELKRLDLVREPKSKMFRINPDVFRVTRVSF
jgi:hypothetical protein